MEYMSDVKAENLSLRLTEVDCASAVLAWKGYHNDHAMFAIANSPEFGWLIPSHFSPSTFTTSAFDNFNHMDKNTLSGKLGIHDIVVTLFQENPTKKKLNLMKWCKFSNS